MGRQQGILRYTGRLGNTVGYLAKDGKGNSFDATRVLAATVTNPQSLAQMTQRMKLAPVVNFYRGLRGILDHSWQTVKYGEPSRLFFYSQTLRALSSAGVPYIVKGDKQFVPWSFPVSSGSIPVVLTPSIPSDEEGYIHLPVVAGESYDQATTVADFTEAMLNVLGITDGMQLTFVWVYSSGGLYIPVYKRIILNSNDNTELTSLGILCNTESGDDLSLAVYSGGAAEEQTVVAAAVIVSKLVNNTWERNNSSMVIADSLRSTYNSQAAFDAMLASYRQTSNSNESDWYLNGGGDESSSTVATVREVTLTTSTGDKTLAYYKVGGTKYAPYYSTILQDQPMICGYRKGGDMAFTKSQAMVLSGGPISDELKTEYLALGYTLCTRDELLAIAPDLTIPE